MNLRENMIVAKGKVITPEVTRCDYKPETDKYVIRFNSGKTFTYNADNVEWMTNPVLLNPVDYEIAHNDNPLFDISEIYEFQKHATRYWHICFENGLQRDYERNSLTIRKSCLADSRSKNVFDYLKEAAEKISLETDEGTKLLSVQYEKIEYVGEDTVFSAYVNPNNESPARAGSVSIPIFPFGCNASQYQAVQAALKNRISVIEGPPGTGKTQTILNIAANLVMSGKTVQIVSNNNSATDNVHEKMESYGLGFIVAPLGKRDNKTKFIKAQTGTYPEEIQSWNKASSGPGVSSETIHGLSTELHGLYSIQQQLVTTKRDLLDIETEFSHFIRFIEESRWTNAENRIRKRIHSDRILSLWHEFQQFKERGAMPSLFFKLKCRFLYGISSWKVYQDDPQSLITLFQFLFYSMKQAELKSSIEHLETSLINADLEGKSDKLRSLSMRYFKEFLFSEYGGKPNRTTFDETGLWKDYKNFLLDYPIILSTTFSSRSSLNTKAIFDYVIVDEASQVDVATGALALSCAKRAVIVGDCKQLPNVVTEDNKKVLQTIFDSYSLNPGYNLAAKSFLQSVCDIFPKAPRTLLREHYRCHPQIINFCNQKFYNGNLLIMTTDNGEKDAISVIKTVVGNHARGTMNQRQADVIAQEILPSVSYADNEIGIITPYNKQVDAIKTALTNHAIETATVHKFQGREKDAIIISTVDDTFTPFTDDPNLLNVAVSRAKRNLWLIVSGNDQENKGNITDLIDYAEYHNLTVTNSAIHSVFDYLYSHYTERRLELLRDKRKISEYDSENLLFAVIDEVLQHDAFAGLRVICHQPLRTIIRDFSRLDAEERAYATHFATHLDFLIFNRITKKPVLAVEVDGYAFHKEGSDQSRRDKMKNHIMESYGIPLLRLATTGSNEKEKITSKLEEVL